MSTDYPGALDSYADKVDGVDDVLAAHINNPQDAIEAIEAELGTDPAGTFATVKLRLEKAYGSCYGNDLAWAQAAAVQNTWYDVSDAAIVDGELYKTTHDGNGKLTVAGAGKYSADWSGAFEADAANVHVEITFSVNGTEVAGGTNDFETKAADREESCAGNAILSLAANDTVNVSFRTTDVGTPDLAIDHLMLRLVQLRGT
ncbi:hypothetical protein LCGC14_0561750 [marine sediment metagenome]|uniref:Uncharacterized protein n=1 Tax=marine sediment metagenome TaxID=412755 RepID=A0A0F9UUZ1_9ZZZZ